MFETPGNYFWWVFKTFSNKFKFEFEIRPCIPQPLPNLFSFFFLQCKPTKRGKEICWDLSLWILRILEKLSPYRFRLASREGGEPEAICQNLFLSLCSLNTAASIDPQSLSTILQEP
jgi:hypothetical protein